MRSGARRRRGGESLTADVLRPPPASPRAEPADRGARRRTRRGTSHHRTDALESDARRLRVSPGSALAARRSARAGLQSAAARSSRGATGDCARLRAARSRRPGGSDRPHREYQRRLLDPVRCSRIPATRSSCLARAIRCSITSRRSKPSRRGLRSRVSRQLGDRLHDRRARNHRSHARHPRRQSQQPDRIVHHPRRARAAVGAVRQARRHVEAAAHLAEMAIVADEVFTDYELESGAARAAAACPRAATSCRSRSADCRRASAAAGQARMDRRVRSRPLVGAAVDRLELICDTHLSVSTPQVAAAALLDRAPRTRPNR